MLAKADKELDIPQKVLRFFKDKEPDLKIFNYSDTIYNEGGYTSLEALGEKKEKILAYYNEYIKNTKDLNITSMSGPWTEEAMGHLKSQSGNYFIDDEETNTRIINANITGADAGLFLVSAVMTTPDKWHIIILNQDAEYYLEIL
jgi:hypothetical protein